MYITLLILIQIEGFLLQIQDFTYQLLRVNYFIVLIPGYVNDRLLLSCKHIFKSLQ